MTRAERIKEARMAAGLTQKELGARMGVSDASIAQYESGQRNPKEDTLRRIAEAVGIDVWELIGWSSIEPDGTLTGDYDGEYIEQAKKDKLTAAFDKLNDEGQDKVVETAVDLSEHPKYKKHP